MSETVHVLYGRSAAATVRQALTQLGVREKVVATGDHLGYGPIDGDLSLRREWFEETLGEHYGECVDFAEAAWKEALAPDAFPICWVCRSDAGDHAGYLEFLLRIGERPFEVIDATGLMIEGRTGSWRLPTLGIVTEDQLLATGVLQRRTTPKAEEVAESRETWRRLKAENALLRITENDVLLSKPISYFDPDLLEEATSTWERGVRIVGNALGRFALDGRCIDDSFIWSRYRTLAKEGALEIEGDDGDMRDAAAFEFYGYYITAYRS